MDVFVHIAEIFFHFEQISPLKFSYSHLCPSSLFYPIFSLQSTPFCPFFSFRRSLFPSPYNLWSVYVFSLSVLNVSFPTKCIRYSFGKKISIKKFLLFLQFRLYTYYRQCYQLRLQCLYPLTHHLRKIKNLNNPS